MLWPTAERMTFAASSALHLRYVAEVTFGFCVSDHGLDGEAAAQLSPNDTEDAALLPEMKTRR
ncbi:hypothetical protein ACVWZV_009939 [Bradyrhizobium sp. GM5.1]